MATTGLDVFLIAMALIDEVDGAGAATPEGTREFSGRTAGLLTSLCGELYPYSDTYAADGARRPVCPPVTALGEPLALDDFLCRSVLPYGLAARLILEDNPSMASFFELRYEELIARYGQMRPVRSEPIEDLYGGLASGGC
jgi:hypothetical protein